VKQLSGPQGIKRGSMKGEIFALNGCTFTESLKKKKNQSYAHMYIMKTIIFKHKETINNTMHNINRNKDNHQIQKIMTRKY
jgi:hypothetical protein